MKAQTIHALDNLYLNFQQKREKYKKQKGYRCRDDNFLFRNPFLFFIPLFCSLLISSQLFDFLDDIDLAHNSYQIQ